MTHHGQAFIRVVLLSHLSASCEAVSLARLVKAEIVSPYPGILINAVISTSQGIMTDKSARKNNLGGEVIAYV